jgi:hypothetical protein
MKKPNRKTFDKKTEDTCPYLALKDDPETISSYPSSWNGCYRVEPRSVPSLSHQHEFCLSKKYVECPLYTAQKKQRMPKEIQYKDQVASKNIKKIINIAGLVLVILLLVVAYIFRNFWITGLDIFGEENQGPDPQLTQKFVYKSPTARIFPNQTTTSIIAQNVATSTPTQVPPTPTATKTNPPLSLETPIGLMYQFVIHRVVEGESLLLFANWYDTSAEAIQAVNLNLTYPIQIGTLVIIPVEILDVTDLPAFEAYEVTQDISVEDLAIKLGVAVEDLMLYNNLESGTLLRSGDWIIVPRERS